MVLHPAAGSEATLGTLSNSEVWVRKCYDSNGRHAGQGPTSRNGWGSVGQGDSLAEDRRVQVERPVDDALRIGRCCRGDVRQRFGPIGMCRLHCRRGEQRQWATVMRIEEGIGLGE